MAKRAFIFGPALLAAAGCTMTPPRDTAPVPADMATLTGSATYLQRIALPSDAKLTVRISDVSRMDVAAPVIAETVVAAAGRQVPLPFSLSYDPARIDPRGSYSVSGRIEDGGGRLIWITDTNNPLPPAGQSIELRLVQVPG